MTTPARRILCAVLTLCLMLGACPGIALAAEEISITLTMPDTLYYGVPVDIPYSITGGTGDIVDAYYYSMSLTGSAGGYSEDIALPAAREGVISQFTPTGDSVGLFVFATDSTGATGKASTGSIPVVPEDDPTHPGVPGAPDPIVITCALPDTIIETVPFEVTYSITGGTGDIVDVNCYYYIIYPHIMARRGTTALPAGRTGSFTCTVADEVTNGYTYELHLFATDSAGVKVEYTSERITVLSADDPSIPDERETAYSAVYDYDFYAEKYPDIISMLGSDRTLVLDYFLEHGMAEGQVGCAGFDAAIYRANYADLDAAFGDDMALYYQHYISSGMAEGRVADELLPPVEPDDETQPITVEFTVPQSCAIGEEISISYTVSGGDGEYGDICYYWHIVSADSPDNTDTVTLDSATGTVKYVPQTGECIELFICVTDGDSSNSFGSGAITLTAAEPDKPSDSDLSDVTDAEAPYSAVYNYGYYTGKYPDIASAYNGDRAAVLTHFINFGMAEGRQGHPDFNVDYYRANYTDLSAAFGSSLKAYYTHYISNGKAEGRVADRLLSSGEPEQPADDEREASYAAVYSYEYYTGKYPDIASAFGGDRTATLNHFINNGMREGRQGIGSFNVDYYRANYADLQKAFGSNLKAYYTHYMGNGKAEGRVADKLLSSGKPEQPDVSQREAYYAPVYDFDYYTGKYADIAKAFGGDRAATLDHFMNHGMDEGRQGCSGFNVKVYRAKNADLEAAFGGDLSDYYKHYINHGKAEGRTAK